MNILAIFDKCEFLTNKTICPNFCNFFTCFWQFYFSLTILTSFDYFYNFRQFWQSTIVDNFCQNLMFLTSLTIVWHFEKMTILTIVDSFDIFYKYRKSDFFWQCWQLLTFFYYLDNLDNFEELRQSFDYFSIFVNF